MTLRDVTRTVIGLVENASGLSGGCERGRFAKNVNCVTHCRGANRIHVISYNLAIREPDYLICYQRGFILRLFGVPERAA